MSRSTVVIEDVKDYYKIISGIQRKFQLPVKSRTTNGLLFENSVNHDEVRVVGRIDDDEETTTIVIECKDEGTACEIGKWVKENYA